MKYFSLLLLLMFSCSSSENKKLFDIDELTVENIHAAFRSGDFSSEQLVKQYIKRIETYDQSTGLNSILLINPEAITIARALDEEFKTSGVLRPLHGIPLIVKDNFNTSGLQTTAGSVALKGFIPKEDAYQIKKLVEAGAVVLAKSNMAEWAFTPMHTQSSMGGETLNPYNLGHVPAGSSGGTGAAVASNFGTIGVGSDTGNSIRGPSSHNCLVGFRTTLGLTSREGIVPLYLRNDVGGPMCRTVEDATRMLQVIAGYDPNDPITKHSEGKVPANYLTYLDKNGLKGARIGVLRQLMEDVHPEVNQLFDEAIRDMIAHGAEIVDPLVVGNFDSLRAHQWCGGFKNDIANYLSTYVHWDSLQNIDDIIAYGHNSELVKNRLIAQRDRVGRGGSVTTPCADAYTDELRIAFRNAIESEMDRLKLDAIIYPTWNYPPAKIGDDEGYKGDNSQVIAPHTGQPAFTIPMGFTENNLPAGIQFLGRMFDEPTLIKLTFSYEQATHHRKKPNLVQ